MSPLRPIHLLLDFDSTLTTTSTIPALMSYVYASHPAASTLPPLSHFTRAYLDDLASHTSTSSERTPSKTASASSISKTATPPHPDRTDAATSSHIAVKSLDRVHAALEAQARLRPVEKRSIRRLEQAGVFEGIASETSPGQTLREASQNAVNRGQVVLRPGWAELVRTIVCQGGRVGVVSVAWSRAWIEGCLSAGWQRQQQQTNEKPAMAAQEAQTSPLQTSQTSSLQDSKASPNLHESWEAMNVIVAANEVVSGGKGELYEPEWWTGNIAPTAEQAATQAVTQAAALIKNTEQRPCEGQDQQSPSLPSKETSVSQTRRNGLYSSEDKYRVMQDILHHWQTSSSWTTRHSQPASTDSNSSTTSPSTLNPIPSSNPRISSSTRIDPLVIYVGDAPTDLACLVSADVGVCLRGSQPWSADASALASLLEDAGVPCPFMESRTLEMGVPDPAMPNSPLTRDSHDSHTKDNVLAEQNHEKGRTFTDDHETKSILFGEHDEISVELGQRLRSGVSQNHSQTNSVPKDIDQGMETPTTIHKNVHPATHDRPMPLSGLYWVEDFRQLTDTLRIVGALHPA